MRSKYVLPLLAVVLMTIACNRGANPETITSNSTATAAPTTAGTQDFSDTAAATNPASPGGTALVPTTNAGTTVLVSLNDGSIVVTNPDSIPAGPAVFTVTNAGSQVHNLFIEGPGVSQAAGDNMPPGKVQNVNVTLQPGKYLLYCPILDHKAKGEAVDLIIKPPQAPAPTSTAVPAAPTDTVSTTPTTATNAPAKSAKRKK